MMRKRNVVRGTPAKKKRIGRPPKSPEDRRSHKERLTFTQTEIQKIELASTMAKKKRATFEQDAILSEADRVIRDGTLPTT
jgi:hypothetical protein